MTRSNKNNIGGNLASEVNLKQQLQTSIFFYSGHQLRLLLQEGLQFHIHEYSHEIGLRKLSLILLLFSKEA